MSAPQGQEIGPTGLELPAGARNRRKATMKPANSDSSFDPRIFVFFNIFFILQKNVMKELTEMVIFKESKL